MAEPLPFPSFGDEIAAVPFEEAIAWHAQQAPWISGTSWNTMAQLSSLKATQAADATLLHMVDDVWGQIGKALEEGLPYGEFTRNLAERLESQWWKVDSPRLKLIHHNNVGNALMAGRVAQLTDPAVMDARPYWLYDAIVDQHTTVDICLPRDGTILPADHEWWERNTPLLHHGCRAGIVSLDEEEADEFGGVTNLSKVEMEPAQEGWGQPAAWQDWEPTPDQYHAPLWAEYEAWTNGEPYAHTKGEWDQKLRDYVTNILGLRLDASTTYQRYIRPAAEAHNGVPTTGEVVWLKEALHDGQSLNEVPFKPAEDGYWKDIQDVPTGEPDIPTGLGQVSTGLVVMEPDGRIWVIEPTNHFGGYEHTFPKGKLESDLSPQQNALKEVYEEAGLSAEITGYIGDFKGTMGVSRYYLAKRTGGQPWTSHWESQAVKLIDIDQALNTHLNKERDREIVQVMLAKHYGQEMPTGLKSYVQPPTKPPVPVAAKPSESAKTDPAMPYGLDPSGFVYHSAKQGGSSWGYYVAHPDAPGKTFLIKGVPDAFKAEGEIAGGKLYALANDDMQGAIKIDRARLPDSLVVPRDQKYLTIQEKVAGAKELTSRVGDKYYPDYSALTTDQQAQLLAHGVASWIAGEHDGHAGQYLLHGDLVVHIDFGQALKYTLTSGDKLSLDYHPNDAYGEARPAHMQLLRDIRDGKIDTSVLHHRRVKEAVERAGKITQEQIAEALGDYAELRPGGKDRDEIAALLAKRAKNAKKDWAKLFENVTGQPFDWNATVKPKDQKKPRRPAQTSAVRKPPVARVGIPLDKIEPELTTFGAVSVRADKDILRGQAWRVQKQQEVSARGTRDAYSFTGEIDQTAWPRVLSAMSDKNATNAGKWATAPREKMFEPGDSASSPVLKLDRTRDSAFLGGAVVLKDPRGRYEVTFADPGVAKTAMQGKIRVKVYESDPVEAKKIFTQALKDIDMAELAKQPSKDSARLALMNRALWNIEGGAYTPARSADEAALRLEQHDVPEKSLSLVQNERGYLEPQIKGRWKRYREEGIQYLYHQFTTKDSVIKSFTGADGGAGGLLATVARSENGIVIGGMSSGADMNSGGASSVFTRIVGKRGTSAARAWYSNYSYTAILSPKVLDRADWYGYSGDNFGATNDSSFQSRKGADAHVAKMATGGSSSNETMFRDTIDRESILLFAVTSASQRDQLVNTLKSAGVKTIRGQPVDEMVVIMKTPSDSSGLNPQNPVHAFLMGKRKTYPAWTEQYGGKDE